ncbi:hypothetical protein [Bradyrhizobium macuxiense]|uniref:hypothetical protein n=1 Tax=Bradyrhizobium macuxiense TaxID=1755647 RepID=UPI000A79FCBB|nr:hypothetical protein [Bradyrhizobium macuxiense]
MLDLHGVSRALFDLIVAAEVRSQAYYISTYDEDRLIDIRAGTARSMMALCEGQAAR